MQVWPGWFTLPRSGKRCAKAAALFSVFLIMRGSRQISASAKAPALPTRQAGFIPEKDCCCCFFRGFRRMRFPDIFLHVKKTPFSQGSEKGVLSFTGSESAGTRTQGPYIKSVLLYQLSYRFVHLLFAKRSAKVKQ